MRRYYIYSYIGANNSHIGGNQGITTDSSAENPMAEFDLQEASEIASRQWEGQVQIILSWQEVSHWQFRRYSEFLDGIRNRAQVSENGRVLPKRRIVNLVKGLPEEPLDERKPR